MTYENEGQLDRAMKKAIRDAGVEPGNGYRQMLRDRFLCRVFADPAERFILKGGSGLLARIPDARATRDIDFATTSRESSESALAALEGLVDKNMGGLSYVQARQTRGVARRERLLATAQTALRDLPRPGGEGPHPDRPVARLYNDVAAREDRAGQQNRGRRNRDTQLPSIPAPRPACRQTVRHHGAAAGRLAIIEDERPG